MGAEQSISKLVGDGWINAARAELEIKRNSDGLVTNYILETQVGSVLTEQATKLYKEKNKRITLGPVGPIRPYRTSCSDRTNDSPAPSDSNPEDFIPKDAIVNTNPDDVSDSFKGVIDGLVDKVLPTDDSDATKQIKETIANVNIGSIMKTMFNSGKSDNDVTETSTVAESEELTREMELLAESVDSIPTVV